MEYKIIGRFSMVCLIVIFGIALCGSASEYEEYRAYSFESSGNLIQDWYWLRDRNLSDKGW